MATKNQEKDNEKIKHQRLEETRRKEKTWCGVIIQNGGIVKRWRCMSTQEAVDRTPNPGG